MDTRRYTFGAGKVTQQQPPSSRNSENHIDSLVKTIQADFFEDPPLWPFSCYAPHGGWMTEVGFDKSFEELRYEELKLIKVDKQRPVDVMTRTRQAAEEIKTLRQNYYMEKCKAQKAQNNPGAHHLPLRRNKPTSDAGFGSADRYEGPYGPAAVASSPQAAPPTFMPQKDTFCSHPMRPVDVSPIPPLDAAMDAESLRASQQSMGQQAGASGNGMDQHGVLPTVDETESQWLAAEFEFIPEKPPPREYI